MSSLMVRTGAERVHASMLNLPLSPDPLEIGNVLCKMLTLSDGSGVKRRAF